jgi:hypothetical protein
LGYHEPEIR